MHILGIGGSNHDFSAAVVVDGELTVAVEEERLNHIRHGDCSWSSKPTAAAVDYCCNAARTSIDAFDRVFSNTDIEGSVPGLLQFNPIPLNHHACHAAAAFFTAPIDSAALLVIDGCGEPIQSMPGSQELETISCGLAEEGNFHLACHSSGRKRLSSSNWTYRCENSLGTFYELITEAIGFGEFGEGKTMGLAAFGDDSLYKKMRSFVEVSEDGHFTFDPYGGIYEWLMHYLQDGRNPLMTRARLARAAQLTLEDVVLVLARYCKRQTGARNLCYAGGCALNCSANDRVAREAGFEELFVFPAPGDNGLSVGAALLGSFLEYGKRIWKPDRVSWRRLAYLGKPYLNTDITSALENSALSYHSCGNLAITELAKRISEGEIVGIFRGGAEFGPRALGHRSILADPRATKTRDTVNLRIKSRESFRPLAPMVPYECLPQYFEADGESPFMLRAVPVRQEFRHLLGAICHNDGSARVQTVTEDSDPFTYRLLHEYGQLTGMPVLLNTSFNLNGKPIVESPRDAVLAFTELNLDCMLLEGFLAEKHSPWARRSSITSTIR